METPAPIVESLVDVVIPSAAILVSAAIAFTVLALQFRAARQERRSEAIGTVVAAISHIIAEGSRKRRGADVDLEPAMSSFDATIIQLMLAVRKREWITVQVIRDRMFTEYVKQSPDMEVVGYQVRAELESWALGMIRNRAFRTYSAWSGQYILGGHLVHAWDELRKRSADDPYASDVERDAIERHMHRSAISRVHSLRERLFFARYRR